MARPDYIAGTARKLPTLYDEYGWGAGSDYTELAAFLSDQVAGKDLSARGAVLVLPAGVLIEEAATGTGIDVWPTNDSTTGFAAIVCEDPANKARLQITNNTPEDVGLYSVQLRGHSRLYDCAVGLTSSSNLVGVNAGIIHTRPDADSVIVGCTNNDIIIPNVDTSPVYFNIFLHDSLGGLLLCAYDQSKTVDVGTAIIIGANVGGHGVGYIYNSVFNDLALGVLNSGAFDIECINVCSQGSTAGAGNFYEGSTGVLNLTTCADEQGLTFAADGFTLTAVDGLGTNLSTDATYPFTDDVNGAAWDVWDRSANEPAPAIENTAPTVTSVSPADGTTLSACTSVTLSAVYNDADGDVGSLTFIDGDGNTIGTASGLADGATGQVTWSGLSAGTHSFKVRPNDGTEDGTDSDLVTFTIQSASDPETKSSRVGTSVSHRVAQQASHRVGVRVSNKVKKT